jgi:hypothetical protein
MSHDMNALIRAAAERRQDVARRQVIRKLTRTVALLPTRVFISFDYDENRFEAAALGQQLRRSDRFEVQNWSLKEAAPERTWPTAARAKLNRSDVMVIVVTANTYRAPGVLTEIKIAKDLGVPIRQVHPKRIVRPRRLPCPGAPIWRWTHDNLATILNVPRRRAA